MQALSTTQSSIESTKAVWLLLILGALLLAIPSLYGLATSTWQESDEFHGPLLIGVALLIFWKRRGDFSQSPLKSQWLVGLLCLTCALAVFVFGRLLSIRVLEIGSLILVIASAIYFVGGGRSLKISIYPLLLLAFAIPLPSNFVDAMTTPLKEVISTIAVNLLYLAGYPVAQSGVIIYIGQYQLLVADACSGLKSMFSLTAVGLVYLYITSYNSIARSSLVLIALIPIAFAANVVRVMTLILVTFHLGDSVAQSFVHDFAGMLLFVIATIALVAYDGILGLFFKNPKDAK